MGYYSRTSRSLVGLITATACAVAMMTMSFSTSWATTGPPSYFDTHPETLTIRIERHVSAVMAAFDLMVVAPRPADFAKQDRLPALASVLYKSYNQPGQDWRIAATAYRHIDPGRRAFA